MENTLFTNEFRAMFAVENPKYDEIRRYILQAYNRATGSNLGEDIKSNDDRLIAVVGWLRDHCFLSPIFSPDLSTKAAILSQFGFGCPYRKGGTHIMTDFPIRIKPISYQASSRQKRRAFKKAVAYSLSTRNIHDYGSGSLCLHIVFVIGRTWNKKDLDNLPKILLDSLQGMVFKNDNQIDHLDLIKFRWDGDEDYIHINIGESTTNRHEDVLYHGIHHSWAGQEELRLEDFMEP